MRRYFIIFFSLLLFSLGALLLFAYLSTGWVKSWVESSGFRRMISHEVSKSMKLNGEFAPITQDGLTAVTATYSGTGWPGEAIGLLEANQIRAQFEPKGIFRRVWSVPRIDIDSGRFVLRTPDDALKLHPVKLKPPWYAFLMPSRFYCQWIECPAADVEFTFLGKVGGLKKVHLGATMVERDFRYSVQDGTVDLPMLPTLGVTQLTMFVTREKVDIDTAVFHGLDGDPAHIVLWGRLGMREDKSVKAEAEFAQLPFSQALPEEMKNLLTGRINGKLNWDTDKSGAQTIATGQFELIDSHLEAWAWLKEIARIHNNPDLLVFDFEKAACHFNYHDNKFEIDQLDLNAINKAHVTGKAAYDWNTNLGLLDVDIADIPIAAWLPEEFKPRVNSYLRGHLFWTGETHQFADSRAKGNLILDNTEIRNPVRLQHLLSAYHFRVPDYFWFERARLDFTYEKQNLIVDSIDLNAPDKVSFNGSGYWSHDNDLQLNFAFQFKQIASWLPKKYEQHLSGDLSGRIDWACQNGKMDSGYGSGQLQLNGGSLRNFKFQKTLCRFLKNDSLLKLPLESTRIDWEKYPAYFNTRNIDILSPGKLGVRGNVRIDHKEALSGTLKIGLPSELLTWLPEAETAVFTEKRDGLHWATVKLSGTLQKPQHDFTSQILHVLERHPVALIGLAMRGLSWWLGDLLGTYSTS